MAPVQGCHSGSNASHSPASGNIVCKAENSKPCNLQGGTCAGAPLGIELQPLPSSRGADRYRAGYPPLQSGLLQGSYSLPCGNVIESGTGCLCCDSLRCQTADIRVRRLPTPGRVPPIPGLLPPSLTYRRRRCMLPCVSQAQHTSVHI